MYAPNSPTTYFFQSVSTHLAPFLHLPLVIGGDFNSVIEPLEDKSIARPLPFPHHPPTAISFFATALQLIDPWRLAHPEGKDFTFYSPPHHTLLRIDYLLVNAAILPFTIAISAYIRDFGPSPPTKTWPLPQYLAHNPDLQKVLQQIWSEYELANNAHNNDPNLYWDNTGKAVLRGKIIAFVVSYKRKVLKRYREPSDRLQNSQTQLSQNNFPEHRKSCHEAKAEFVLWTDGQE